MGGQFARKGKAEIGHVITTVVILIDTEQRGWFEGIGRLLERLARHCLDERLAGLEVPRRLVEEPAVLGVFLDQEEAAVALGDRGHGDVGFPDHGVILTPASRAGGTNKKGRV